MLLLIPSQIIDLLIISLISHLKFEKSLRFITSFLLYLNFSAFFSRFINFIKEI